MKRIAGVGAIILVIGLFGWMALSLGGSNAQAIAESRKMIEPQNPWPMVVVALVIVLALTMAAMLAMMILVMRNGHGQAQQQQAPVVKVIERRPSPEQGQPILPASTSQGTMPDLTALLVERERLRALRDMLNDGQQGQDRPEVRW